MTTFDKIGLRVPTVLLPKPGIDLSKWAVIACDQYTSDPGYWERVRDQVGLDPSTLNLIFPEVYLEAEGTEARIAAINGAMDGYLADGTLQAQPPGFILVDRKTAEAPSRKGLIVALDLESYDYTEGSTSLTRATEGTILDRLPPRIRVREKAPIELPHIMVLIDDPGRTVIEPLFEKQNELAYDVPLMLGGGHIKGYRVNDQASINQVAAALETLADPQAFARKYDVTDKAVVLYAMGDGNHSFATAKAIWEKLKKEAADRAAIMDHPARWALVELVNVHDPGLEFEAIHRVLFDVDAADLVRSAEAFYAAQGSRFSFCQYADRAALDAALEKPAADSHRIACISSAGFGLLSIEGPAHHLVVATLQAFLDQYLQQAPGARIDYIHGEEAVTAFGSQAGNSGFYLPSISKHDLFKTIILDGALPRKTFSMGEADEKRFYMECRQISR